MDSNVVDYLRWWNKRETFALATIIDIKGSAPMPLGTSMGIGPSVFPGGDRSCGPSLAVVGSVSGGCVEAAIYDLTEELFASGTPHAMETFGFSDETAFATGLSCGGTLEVFIELVNRDTFPEFGLLAAAVKNREAVTVATVVDGSAKKMGGHLLIFRDHIEGSLGSDLLDQAVRDDGMKCLESGENGNRYYGPKGQPDGGLRVSIHTFQLPPRMLIFGAVEFACALADAGKLIGYHVTVCDARPVFATADRFPQADEVVCKWPHRYLQDEAEAGALDSRTVICVLTHDLKFDIPLLQLSLRLPVAYVGAMASRRTHDERSWRLRDSGLTESEIGRMKSPIGLDLGARSPHETAISIVSEIIASKYGRSGKPLNQLQESIHGQGALIS